MKDTTESNKITVAMFTGKNFPIWKFKMTAYLKEQGCWDVVVSGVDRSGNDTQRSPEKDAAAMAKIVLRIADSEAIKIMACTSAKDAWEELLKVYESKDEFSKIALKRKYDSYQLSNHSIQEYLNELNLLRVELQASGVYISEEDHVLQVINGLTGEFKMIATGMLGNTMFPDLNFVTKRLLAVESLGRQDINPKKAAMNAHQKGKEKDHDHGKKKIRPRCANCNKKGHKAANCWAKGGGAEGQGPKEKKNENKEKAEENFNGKAMMANKVPILPYSTSPFFLDSGATDHLINNNENLYNYTPLQQPVYYSTASEGKTLKGLGVGD
jgi:hypothetical protein